MRQLLIYMCCCFLIPGTSKSQYWGLSIKPGAAIGIVASGNATTGYAYLSRSFLMPRPAFAIEFSRINLSKKYNFICGITLLPVTNSFAFNDQNIDLSKAFGGSPDGGEYAIQIYAGAEKKFNRRKSGSYRNYFSVIAGIGLNDYTFRPAYPELGVTVTNYAETLNGEQLTGTSFGYSSFRTGAISVFCGIRYNITNPAGKIVAVLELASNYGITKYFDHRITYRINNEHRLDFLAEKGGNIQFNIKIPVAVLIKKRSNDKEF